MSHLLDNRSVRILEAAITALSSGFSHLPESTPSDHNAADLHQILQTTASKLHDNFPYFHPLYAGQMLKPPHPVARLAYELAMQINPNNHALDGGRASSAMEKEAVAEIARMFGWMSHLGHLCSGGTIANLEALWIARELRPGTTVVASSQAHYTHARMCGVLGQRFESIPCTAEGNMDLSALEARLHRGGVGTVVASVGTTATGAIDPIPELIALREKYGFQLHADAAYGGYYMLADNIGEGARNAFGLLREADSIVIDPHKHGLQPYGCGCVLFRDPSVGKFYRHDSPYTYFTSSDLHLGEISLECSRPGAAAVALWATQQLFPLIPGGEFARRLSASHAAAIELHRRLLEDPRFETASAPELDIVVWIPRASSFRESSALSRHIFARCAGDGLHLALAELPMRFFRRETGHQESDGDTVTALRSVLMKPEHLRWIDRIWNKLDRATDQESPAPRT